MLFSMRLRGFLNSVWRRPARYIVGLVFFALTFWSVLATTRWGVRFLFAYPAIDTIAPAVAQRSLEALFVILTLGVAFSVLTTAITTLYSSEDLPFLLSLPLGASRVFGLKVFETYVAAALMPLLFTLPVLIGLGIERGAPWVYYPLAGSILLSLYALPVAIGCLLALFLVRIAPAGRVKELATGLSVVFAAGLIFSLRALRPEQLADMTLAELERFLQQLAEFQLSWLPTSWSSQAVWKALDGEVSQAAYGLVILSLLLLAVVSQLAAFAYREGWIRALESGMPQLDPAPRQAAWWERPLHRLGARGSMVVKDTRLMLRDPTQWSQLLVLVALGGVYLVSISSVDVPQQRFKDAVGTMNLMFMGFLLSGIGVRTAFPLVSLEGEGFWLLKTGPVRARDIVLAKFWGALPSMLILGGGLGLTAAFLLEVSAVLAVASPVAGLSAAVVSTALGVGLGAAFPRFDATNASEIPLSPGGFLYMALGFFYAVLLAVILAWPAWQTLHPFRTFSWLNPEGQLIFLIILAVTALMSFLPLYVGSYRLARYEPGD